MRFFYKTLPETVSSKKIIDSECILFDSECNIVTHAAIDKTIY